MTRHALHLYQVAIDAPAPARDRIVQRLIDTGIGAAVHYIAVHLHPYYADRIPDRFPNAEWASEHLVTLPLHMHLEDADVVRVCRAVDDAVREVTSTVRAPAAALPQDRSARRSALSAA
jgi:UDP-4-amino-4-deoxy-L-arabinose-oxoglutarate aminotransferase